MTDKEARHRALQDGLPWDASLEHYVGQGAYSDFLSEPRYDATRNWIYSHGTREYLSWLSQHPIDRAEEVVQNSWFILTPPDFGHFYMPAGWRGNSYGGRVLRTVRGATENPILTLCLIILVPLWWRRIRSHSVAPIVRCLIWSGVVGVFVAYYGDAMEMARHAWGASQQILLMLWFGLCLRLEMGARSHVATDLPSPASPISR